MGEVGDGGGGGGGGLEVKALEISIKICFNTPPLLGGVIALSLVGTTDWRVPPLLGAPSMLTA